jgi:hypothetical protein
LVGKLAGPAADPGPMESRALEHLLPSLRKFRHMAFPGRARPARPVEDFRETIHSIWVGLSKIGMVFMVFPKRHFS